MTESQTINPANNALFTMQLPSRLESLSTVENFVEKLTADYQIADDTHANILTCMSEAIMNAVVHGNKEDPEKKVFVNVEVQDGKRVIFTVADEGPGFDYNHIPDPTAPENIENLTGRGVYIIKQLADQCIFNASGNEVELHFKI
ncbi:MAG: ATP-binding protein [Sphingobacteriaceae bacterium]|jgi:serine/threonine-protein kinase RsbW|nr:ATP-binding protein [Sphingobacteriaceae bacterium]